MAIRFGAARLPFSFAAPSRTQAGPVDCGRGTAPPSAESQERPHRLAACRASLRLVAIAVVTLVSLGLLGLLGGASVGRAALRVMLGGALAMAITAGIGRLLGIAGL